MKKKKIAFCILKGENAGAVRNAAGDNFYARGEVGALVVKKDIEESTGIEVDLCTPETAKNFDVVLISMTSNYDMIGFARQVKNYSWWRKGKRPFISVAGGFGMQNPYHVQDYLDFAYFGRAENEFGEIIKANFEYESDSLMRIREQGLHPVIFRQAEKFLSLENYKVSGQCHSYKEELQGCPNKCTYCHYTYARKHKGRKDFVLQMGVGNSIELEWMDATLYDPKYSRVTTALDGISERSRYVHSRRLSDETIAEFFEQLMRKTNSGGVILSLYNILGMEAVDRSAWDKYLATIESLEPIARKIEKRLTIKMTNTPFRPSPLTPCVYSPVNLDYAKEMTRKVREVIYDADLSVRYNEGRQVKLFARSVLESRASLISDLSVIRGGVKHSTEIFNLFAYNPKFRALRRPQQWKYIRKKYDLTDLTREYDVEEQHPTWFLNGYIPNSSIKKMRGVMKKRMSQRWCTETKRFYNQEVAAAKS